MKSKPLISEGSLLIVTCLLPPYHLGNDLNARSFFPSYMLAHLFLFLLTSSDSIVPRFCLSLGVQFEYNS